MAKKLSVDVIYTPHRSMPSNFPGEFKVPGWGSVVLPPKQPSPVAVNLAKFLLTNCKDRVALANPSDAKLLGKDFIIEEPAAEPAPAEKAPEQSPLKEGDK